MQKHKLIYIDTVMVIFKIYIHLKLVQKSLLGNFKKYLDFSQFSIYPKFTLSEGESPFDFDYRL